MKTTRLSSIFIAALLACLAPGCSSTPKNDPVAFTESALAATSPAQMHLIEKGSPAEQKAIEQFERYNGDFSKSNIVNNTKVVYAADIYFRDPFKEIHGEPEFEAYLLRGADNVTEFSMEWKNVSESQGDYYFRWIMTLKIKRDSQDKPASRTTGISHVRFGADGKVVFHQDYFDGAAFLYEKIPVLGTAIRAIKKRM